jgi:VTC domain
MNPATSSGMRSNLATWCVPTHCLPALGRQLPGILPPERYDPGFKGQELETVYFDTCNFDLRKARLRKDYYLTLRVRRYGSGLGQDVYALSAKTESEKWRTEITVETAEWLLSSEYPGKVWADLLPGNLLARLLSLVDNESLAPVVKVCCRRYAVENDQDRLTLDVHTHTSRGACLPFQVLEFKSTDPDAQVPVLIQACKLAPLKLSKFLWATEV